MEVSLSERECSESYRGGVVTRLLYGLRQVQYFVVNPLIPLSSLNDGGWRRLYLWGSSPIHLLFGQVIHFHDDSQTNPHLNDNSIFMENITKRVARLRRGWTWGSEPENLGIRPRFSLTALECHVKSFTTSDFSVLIYTVRVMISNSNDAVRIKWRI